MLNKNLSAISVNRTRPYVQLDQQSISDFSSMKRAHNLFSNYFFFDNLSDFFISPKVIVVQPKKEQVTNFLVMKKNL